MTEQRNLILAIVLSVAILVGFQFLFDSPTPPPAEQTAQQQADTPVPQTPQGAAPGIVLPSMEVTRQEALGQADRLRIDTPSLHGSINLVGGRLDDLTLANYRETPDPTSPEIKLLNPVGGPLAYYAEFGWVAPQGVAAPDQSTVWTAQGGPLAPASPVTLTWDNGQGLTFTRKFEIDRDYMFTITQSVVNQSGEAVTLNPYGLISRTGLPRLENFYILHEGPLGVFDETLAEYNYDEVAEENTIEKTSTGGWIGITDKYWLTALIPGQDEQFTARFLHRAGGTAPRYQVDFMGSAQQVASGGEISTTHRLFAGAKEVRLLDSYAERYSIDRFDLAIDFGWFYFMTKPFFLMLQALNAAVGNFGIAILILTVGIKLVLFPLANKSYRSMSNMKKLQPKMKELQERFGQDRQRLNQEMMALYKREKVNPVSGCLPVLIQIPIFFALYKVLFITIEMRHAPFYGWINDLSAPDPTTLFNLFGLVPWDPPSFLMIGVWPLIMGITMFLQQKLNPQPADPIQAKMFMILPVVFTFLLASFPAGLVIYWAWSNTLSILQQWVIMRRAGVKP